MTFTDEEIARVTAATVTERSITQAADVLAFMRHNGSSLTLNWGEDTDQWECSWITGGDRFTGVGRSVLSAVMQSYEAMRKKQREE
jgi:hypothetical protein